MNPSSHEEFEQRDLDRDLLERKQGKSIMELIQEGYPVPEQLLKEHEFDLMLEKQPFKADTPDSTDSTDTPNSDENIIFDSKGRPEFDDDGLSIDYEDKELSFDEEIRRRNKSLGEK